MENRRLVLPEHLNHYGFLFGGQLLRWVDEVAWIAGSLDYPGCKLVTVAMDEVRFRKSIRGGTVLRFVTERASVGVTSVNYRVDVFGELLETGGEEPVFSTGVTQVRIGDDGDKLALPTS
ncbi:MAG: acyl-CoA thioesterase [Verrucomicrobiales bacterium]|nr:acyl-CoA thioesterase [Verrucomicrobiales bacterium]